MGKTYIKSKLVWNKGLTKETDERIRNYAERLKGHPNYGYKKGESFWKDKKLSEKHKQNISIAGKASPLRPRGAKCWNWKGGRQKKSEGYILVKAPNHPFTCKYKGYVLEHRLVMEKKIKRYLNPWEIIHHINGVRDDNRIENLQLLIRNHPPGHSMVCPKCGHIY